MKSAPATMSTRAFLIAALLAVLGIGLSASSASAAFQNCGSISDQRVYVEYNSTLARCQIIFDARGQRGTYEEYTGVMLPSWTTNINLVMVGGGGSGGADADYQQGGGGGGGGAIYRQSSVTIGAGTPLTIRVGGETAVDLQASGYLGQNGIDTSISFTNGSTTYSATARGGSAPSSGNVTQGGAGGTTTSSNMWPDSTASYAGVSGTDTSYRQGLSLSGFADRLGSGGGGGAGSDDVGRRAPGYGSGGGGISYDGNGSPQCNRFDDYSSPCNGSAGVVRMLYEPLNYFPVAWNGYPNLSGDAIVGNPLMIENISYTGADLDGGAAPTRAIQWYRCTGTATQGLTQATGCSSIAGATSDTYTPVVGDLNYKLQAKVTFTNSGSYLPSNTSSTTQIVGYTETQIAISTPGAPTLSAVTVQSPTKAKLTISQGTNWGESKTLGFKDFGANIVKIGTLSGSDLSFTGLTPGTTYTVKAFQQNAAGITYSSAQLSFTMPAAVVSTAVGSVAGDVRIGSTLTYTASQWVGSATVTSTATWYSCTYAANPIVETSAETDVSGWTGFCTSLGAVSTVGNSLTINSGLAGKYIMVKEIATDGYSSTYRRINTAASVQSVPGTVSDLVATSTAARSISLTFTIPAAGASSISSYKFDYQNSVNNYASTVEITSGFSSSTSGNQMTLTYPGFGTGTLKFRVYARNTSGWSLASNFSQPLDILAAAGISGTPTISGTAAVGSTLTASETGVSASGNPVPTISRSWWVCDSAPSSTAMTGCTVVAGETGLTYIVGAEAGQKYVVLRTAATNTTGATVNNAYVKSVATALVPGTPGQVTSISATVSSSSSVAVTFSLPSNVGAGPVTGVQYRFAAGPGYSYGASWTDAPNTNGSFNISNLTPNTAYKVQIRAGNLIGFGSSAEIASAFTTYGPAGVGNLPSLSGTAHVGQMITATEPSGMFSGNPTPTVASRAWYRCASSKNAGDELTDCLAISGATSQTYTLTSNDTSKYVVYAVVGSNSEGQSTARSASTVIVANVPAAPTISSATLNGSASASIVVLAGATNNSPITNLEYELGESGTWISRSSANLTFTLTGLTNGSVNSVRVRLSNQVGTSAASQVFHFTPLATSPTPSATRADGSIGLSWASLAGASNYTVQISTQALTGFANATSSCLAISQTACSISALTNGQDYYLKLIAANEFGSAVASAVVGPIRPLSRIDTLSALEVRTRSGLAANQILTSLSPVFDANTRAYSVSVANSAQFITIVAVRSISGQLIKLNGTTLSSGATSSNVALNVGANTVTLEVQSNERVADANSTAVANYVITVNRAQPDMSGFTSLGGSNTAVAPAPISFSNVGVTGVTNSNVAAINSAISDLSESQIDSPAELQAVVDAYVNVIAQSNGGSPSQAPTASVYNAIGVTEASGFSSAQIAYLNSIVSQQTTEQISQISNIKVLATAISNLYLVAAGTQQSAITLEQLSAMGVTGATASNLSAIIAAISATADDGSGINSLSKVQALVDLVKGSALSTVSTRLSANQSLGVQDIAEAGVVGISDSNLAALNEILAATPSGSRDSTQELQQIVDSFKFLVSQTKGGSTSEVTQLAASLGISSPQGGPTAAIYSALGATAAASLNSAAISLLNSSLPALAASRVDSPSELNALAASVTLIQSNVVSATVADFQLLGFTGVTANNLATIKTILANLNSSAKDTFGEIQLLIDNAISISNATNFANSSAPGAPAPTAQDLTALGVFGVTTTNLTLLNDAIRSAAQSTNPVGSWVATAAAIQTILDALQATHIATISGYSGVGAAPAISDYSTLGVIGVTQNNLASVNEIIAGLSSDATDSPTEVQAIVISYRQILTAAAADQASMVTLADLQRLGITGVTSGNLRAIANAISGAAVASVDSLAELQALVTLTVSQASTSLSNVLNFTSNAIAIPTLGSYLGAGLTGVSAQNKSLVDQAILEANPAPTNSAELQSIIDGVVAAPLQRIVSAVEKGETVGRLSDFALSGISGVTSSNLANVSAILAQLPSSSRDSITEVQRAVDAYNLVLSASAGGVNVAPGSPKPSAGDFEVLGVNLGPISSDAESFEFLLASLAKMPQTALGDLQTLQKRVDVIIDLIRISSRKSPLTELTVADLNSIGLAGVTSANLATVLTEISTGTAGVAGLTSIEAAVLKYSTPAVVNQGSTTQRTPDAETPGKPADGNTTEPEQPAEPSAPSPLPRPATIQFSAGSTVLSSAAKKAIVSQVNALIKAKPKAIVVTVRVTLPKNASAAWAKKVMNAARARANSVSAVVKSQLRLLKSAPKAVVKIQTTTQKDVRSVSISGQR